MSELSENLFQKRRWIRFCVRFTDDYETMIMMKRRLIILRKAKHRISKQLWWNFWKEYTSFPWLSFPTLFSFSKLSIHYFKNLLISSLSSSTSPPSLLIYPKKKIPPSGKGKGELRNRSNLFFPFSLLFVSSHFASLTWFGLHFKFT